MTAAGASAPAGLSGCAEPLATRYELALVDLDGVAYRSHRAIPHAAHSLAQAREAGLRLVFVTNNASREPSTVAEQLTELDIPASPDEVMTAAQAAAALLRTRLKRGDRVLVVGGAGLLTAVHDEGFVVVETAQDEPVAVVQGYSPAVGWEQLAEAAYAIQQGAWHVASNLDLSIPTSRGIAPGNGTLVRAVQAATGVVPDSAGKPSPTMYRMAVERAGADRVLVIGDRLDTDLAGARAGGYSGLAVLTGVSTVRDLILAAPEHRPDYIGADLRALLVPHAAPAPTGHGWWQCAASAARVRAGGVEIEVDGPTTIDTVRAVVAAAWEAADHGAGVDPDRLPQLAVGP